MPDDLVGLRRAAELVERSERTIRRWIDEGKIEAYGLPQSNRLMLRRVDLVCVRVTQTTTDPDKRGHF